MKQALVDHAYTALVTALGKSFRIATVPGPDTLRVRAAITEATRLGRGAGRRRHRDPAGAADRHARSGAAADSSLTVGEASGEVEVTDSLTQPRSLAAGVDRRVGQRSLRGVFSRWDDVEEAWNVWAEQLRMRLVEAGAGHAPAPEK